MHPVHRLAGGIEELQAAPDVAAIALLDGEAIGPRFREDAQVDVVAEHHGMLVAGDHFVVDADLLVHGTFIAGQRHHLADRFEAGQQIIDAGLDAHRAKTAMRRNQFRFRNAQQGSEIALAYIRHVFPRPPDFGRGGFHALVHVVHLPASVCTLALLIRPLVEDQLPCRVIFSR